ncbi:MAG: carbohydrate-binding domain-containing protein, partial [Pseudomonadota bacterium]
MAASLLLWSSVSDANPVCQSSSSDADNDGWGWENNASCIVDAAESSQFSSTRDSKPVCRYASR